ncbi:Rho-related protein racG [Entamoeba marina]
MSMRPIKLGVVGDEDREKVCFLCSYTTNAYPSEYIPTYFEPYNYSLTVEDIKINLGLFCYYRHDGYERLRPLSYPSTDVFLLCYSIDSPSSFNNIEEKWKPEIEYYCPDASIILVGLKMETRTDYDVEHDIFNIKQLKDNGKSFITTKQGESMAKRIGAYKFCECSALTLFNVKTVFEEAVRSVISKPINKQTSKKKKKKWF